MNILPIIKRASASKRRARSAWHKALTAILLLLLAGSAAASRTDTLRLEAAPVVANGKPTVHFAYVYVPDAANDEALPAVYLFHGFMGNQYSWEMKAGVSALLDSLIGAGAIRPVIAVMPYCIPKDTTQAVQIRSFVYNASHYGRLKRGEFEKTFAGLDRELRTLYPIQPDSCCAIAGLSYGGRVAANLALGHHYKVVGLFSPVIARDQVPDCDDPARSCSSLYWLRIGRHDIFEPMSYSFRRRVEAQHLNIDYKRTPGGHNWKNWRQYLIDFLTEFYPAEEK